MKSVGKQLQEARLAKNWTPELAARETKIKVDRLRDLEGDDYTHFSSPTYARGFVRTYARFLGLDEYKILRQLDNKLPDDDTSTIVTDSGVPYIPETSMPPRVAHRDYTGLYVVTALAGVVLLISAFVLFEAYRVGELPRYFANSPLDTTTTNSAPVTAETETPPVALPVNPNDTSNAPKAEAVDPASLVAEVPPAAVTNAAPADAATDVTQAVKALPVDPSALNNAAPVTSAAAPANLVPPVALPVTGQAPPDASMAPRALPVDPSQLATTTPSEPSALTNAAPQNYQAPPSAPPVVPLATSASARQSNSRPAAPQPAPASAPAAAPSNPVAPAAVPAIPVAPVAAPAAPAPPPATTPPTTMNTPQEAPTDAGVSKPLILTASQDSFVRVTSLDAPDSDKPLYASVLRSGQSVAFDGRKFSINVGIPSAVDIKLDGVNYGPHSDLGAPETFTVESHLQ